MSQTKTTQLCVTQQLSKKKKHPYFLWTDSIQLESQFPSMRDLQARGGRAGGCESQLPPRGRREKPEVTYVIVRTQNSLLRAQGAGFIFNSCLIYTLHTALKYTVQWFSVCSHSKRNLIPEPFSVIPLPSSCPTPPAFDDCSSFCLSHFACSADFI